MKDSQQINTKKIILNTKKNNTKKNNKHIRASQIKSARQF